MTGALRLPARSRFGEGGVLRHKALTANLHSLCIRPSCGVGMKRKEIGKKIDMKEQFIHNKWVK
jgi:hypothetical protein